MSPPKRSTTVVSVYFPQIHEFPVWSPNLCGSGIWRWNLWEIMRI